MTSDGSAYVRFRRALKTGNELLVLATARELPRIALDDALRICLVLRDGDPERYERAAVRWLGRFALEARDVAIEDLRRAAEALDARYWSSRVRPWSGFRPCVSCAECIDRGDAEGWGWAPVARSRPERPAHFPRAVRANERGPEPSPSRCNGPTRPKFTRYVERLARRGMARIDFATAG